MFDKGSVIIRDASKLAFDYVPVELINRDAEMEMLEMLMRPVAESGASDTAFITGSVGKSFVYRVIGAFVIFINIYRGFVKC